MLRLVLIFVSVGLLFIGLAVPMILRLVPPNGLYGLRVSATFAHSDVWYDANERSGWDLLWLGIALVLLAVGLPAVGIEGAVYAEVWSVTAAVGAFIMAGVGWRRANRLLEQRRAASSERPNNGLQGTDPRA